MITKEEDNFLRTVYLHYRVGTRALRRYFDSTHPNLASDLSLYYNILHNLYRRKILYQAQWDKLYPPTGSNTVSTADFDVTLMVCLLRNLPPTVSKPATGFDALPVSSDISDGAHIARIKYYKNILVSHSKDGMLSDTFKMNIWNDLEKAIHGLGNHTDVKDAADAKSKVLDYESVKKLANQYEILYQRLEDHDTKITKIDTKYVQQNRKRLNDHAKQEYKQYVQSIKVSKLDTSVENMKTEMQAVKKDIYMAVGSRKDWMIKNLQKWKKEDEDYFVETTASNHVMTCILDNKCVSVVGPPGVGKTFLVQHVALAMETIGFSVISVKTPNEIKQNYQLSRKLLFVVDDMCGNFTANTERLDEWKKSMAHLTTILDKDSCKLILTFREQVFRDEGFKHSDMDIFQTCKCNLLDEKLALTSSEKENIAIKYFSRKNENEFKSLFNYDFFPLLCKLYVNKTFSIQSILNDPFHCYRKELNNLFLDSKEGKYKICALLFLTVCNNHIEKQYIAGKNDKVNEILDDICYECGVNEVLTGRFLMKELDALTGTFVSDEQTLYHTIHDKLFDFLAYYFGTKNEVTSIEIIGLLIKHAENRFIMERLVIREPGKSDDQKREEYLITIQGEYIPLYIKRVFSDLTKSNSTISMYKYLEGNRNKQNKSFQDNASTFLNQLSEIEISNLIQTASSDFVCSMFVMNVSDIKPFCKHVYYENEHYGIILGHDQLHQYIERLFDEMTKSNYVRSYIQRCRCGKNKDFVKAIQSFLSQLPLTRIKEVIKDVSSSFVQTMFVVSVEEIKPKSRKGYMRYGMLLTGVVIQDYIKRIFDEMASSDDVNKHVLTNRNLGNAKFHAELLRHTTKLDRENIEHLIKKASGSFIYQLCVITEKDINEISNNECERYGVVIPDESIQMYIERWFNEMTKSECISTYFEKNRNKQTSKFTNALLTYLADLKDDQIETLIKTASKDFVHNMFVTMNMDLKNDITSEFEQYRIVLQDRYVDRYFKRILDFNDVFQARGYIKPTKRILKCLSQLSEVRIIEIMHGSGDLFFHQMITVDIGKALTSNKMYSDYISKYILELNEGLITCPASLINLYIDRMISDWSKGKLSAVFKNINLKNQSFVEKFFDHLNILEPSKKSELVNINDIPSGHTSLEMSCKEGEGNLARWCLEYHLHENPEQKHNRLCAFFLLTVFYNQLEEAIINDGLIQRTDRQFSFKTMLHILDEISAKDVINELNTSLKLIGVAKEAGVYSIRSDMFHFLVFYFASIRQMSKYLVEFADEKLLCESFIAEKPLFHQHNLLILLPKEEYLTCIKRVFTKMTHSGDFFRYILKTANTNYLKSINACVSKLNQQEITSIIENSSIDFVYELCVLTAKAIQDRSDEEPEHYIVIPDDCTAIYIKRIFDHVAKSDCVEDCLQGNRNNRNKTFYSKLFIYMHELNRDEVESLIRQASSDFINRIFVISEKDINHESCWEYERYGIVVPEDLLQVYIERVFSDMTQSLHEPVNRNSGDKTFRDILYSYINSFSEDELTSLIHKASSKFIGRLFLLTESYSKSIGLPRFECNYMFVPKSDVPIQKRKIEKMPYTRRQFISHFEDKYEMYEFKHDATEFTVTFHDNRGRDNMFITVTSMNKISIDNLQQHLVQYIDPLFTNKQIKCCVRSSKQIVSKYIQRMEDDWLDGQVCDVFGNINFGNPSFQCDFITNLRNIEHSRQTMLAKMHDKNTQFSPLEICSYVGISQVSEWCLDNQANDNIDVYYMRHPLYIAFIHNHPDIVITLLNHKNKWYSNHGDSNCYSQILYEACEGGKINFVMLLLKEGVDVNKICLFATDKSPLYVACERGHDEIVSFLLDYKADEIDINLKANYGFSKNDSPLNIACKRGHTAIVSLLLNHVTEEIDVNTTTTNGETPLYTASDGGYTDIVDLLLAHEVIEVNKSRFDGASPLWVACSRGYAGVVSSLLNYNGIGIDQCNLIGISPVFIASLLKHTEIVKRLLDKKADSSICVKKKEIVMQIVEKLRIEYRYALNSKKYIEYTRKLVSDNASEDVQSYIEGKEEGWVFNSILGASPLHMGSLMGNIEIVKLLIESNSNINCFSENASTPLFLACELGHKDIVHVLLANGADPTLNRKDGKSPLAIAEDNWHVQVVEHIKSQTVYSSSIKQSNNY